MRFYLGNKYRNSLCENHKLVVHVSRYILLLNFRMVQRYQKPTDLSRSFPSLKGYPGKAHKTVARQMFRFFTNFPSKITLKLHVSAQNVILSDEGLKLKTSVLESFTVANLPHRPCG